MILCKCAVVAVLRDVEKEVNCNKGAVVGQVTKQCQHFLEGQTGTSWMIVLILNYYSLNYLCERGCRWVRVGLCIDWWGVTLKVRCHEENLTQGTEYISSWIIHIGNCREWLLSACWRPFRHLINTIPCLPTMNMGLVVSSQKQLVYCLMFLKATDMHSLI